MHCQYCGSINAEDDHRCLRCGRRLTGIAITAPPSYIGATALAVSATPSASHPPDTDPRPEAPVQPPLFHAQDHYYAPDQKVIPFEQVQRQAANRFGSRAEASAPAPASRVPASPVSAPRPPRAASKRQPMEGQGDLDFRPYSSQGERVLPTGVTAQVSGDGRVAPPMRRVTAGAMDVSMVLLGFGVFAGTVRFGGSAFGAGKAVWITLALALVLLSLFYGLVWAIARRETAGMSWTQLQLVTFDGAPLDGRNRAIRFVSAWLSYGSGGLGLLWALADEENLAFHDHISKTYPTEKGSSGVFVRQRQ